MPDTKANAAAFGKSKNQHGECGFPLCRIVAVFCLATGAVVEMAVGAYGGKQTGELSLFRTLLGCFKDGDVVVGDRLFGSYCDIVSLLQRGVDGVYRLNAQRKVDFRRGRRLGKEDHVVVWYKPKRCPKGFSQEVFDALPETLEIREMRIRISTPGFRVKSMVLVTTLTDPTAYPKAEIASLYRQRWHAELDIRSIKITMKMDVLRCMTPEMVRKEVWAHMLAYNLIRSVMCEAADAHGLLVRDLSFKSTWNLLDALREQLIHADAKTLSTLCDRLFAAICQHRVGNRPDRIEPRKRKRAPKPYKRMKKTRAEERKLLL